MSGARLLAAALVAALASGCASTALPPPPRDVRRIAVLPPVNRTGRVLAVSGAWWLERALGQPRADVPDVMAAEARALLAARGFQVVPPGPDVQGLRFELLRWIPDPSGGLDFIGVDAQCVLLTPDGEVVLWRATRRRWPVPVRGAPSAAIASERAARTIVETFLADWRPAP